MSLRESFETAPEFGGQVYVLEAGAAAAPPLVLIHGLGAGGARDFELLLAELSQHYHVLSFDLPGFGRSTRGYEVYSPERYAHFVHAMITRHFPGPAAVLGHSMGAAIALQLAGDIESVSRLALLDVAGVLHYQEYLRTLVRAERSDDGFFKDTLKRTRKLFFGIGWWPIPNANLKQLGLTTQPRRYFSSTQTAALLFVQHDFGPALRKIRVPTFLGWGRRDDNRAATHGRGAAVSALTAYPALVRALEPRSDVERACRGRALAARVSRGTRQASGGRTGRAAHVLSRG